jgi:hypothetical protein
MGLIIGSQNIMGPDYGSKISDSVSTFICLNNLSAYCQSSHSYIWETVQILFHHIMESKEPRPQSYTMLSSAIQEFVSKRG